MSVREHAHTPASTVPKGTGEREVAIARDSNLQAMSEEVEHG
jgi:hypothetical protein